MTIDSFPDSVRRTGRAMALAAAVRDARMLETASALTAAANLRTLRDERLANALGSRDVGSLIARDVRSLDRRSTRMLLRIADLIADKEMSDSLAIGLVKLGTLAAADRADAESVFVSAHLLPRSELRRALASARDERISESARRGTTLPTDPDPIVPIGAAPVDRRGEITRATAATTLLAGVSRGWRDVGDAAFAAARGIAALRDDGLLRLLGDTETEIIDVLDLEPAEIDRACDLVVRCGNISVAVRERVGISALRAIARITDDDARAALIHRVVTDEHLAGDDVIALTGRVIVVEPTTPFETEAAPGIPLVDDPMRIVPVNVLYLPDPVVGVDRAGFLDATPEMLIDQLLRRTTGPGDAVVDLTAGSGTVARVASPLGRTVTSLDLIDPPLDRSIRVADARNVALSPGSAACIFFHPPTPGGFAATERYGVRAAAGDLALMLPSSYEDACLAIFTHASTILAPGGYLVIVASEGRIGSDLYDTPGRLVALATRAGLSFADRLYAVRPPAERRTIVARSGNVSSRERRSIGVVIVASILRRPIRSGAHHG
jgi:hypothetical protein